MTMPEPVGGVPRPSLQREQLAWSRGARWVAGIDEVGRGALAGPVYAGAVVLPRDDGSLEERLAHVRDSKLLSPRARCRLYGDIVGVAVAVGVGAAAPLAVDALGIARATQLAMVRAIARLSLVPDYLLVDGFNLTLAHLPHEAVRKGDRDVLSIAAASIVAKVHRDAWMIGLAARRPGYGFDRHKGYGTAHHACAIHALGRTTDHRLTWSPLRRSDQQTPRPPVQLTLPLTASALATGVRGRGGERADSWLAGQS